jgi:release factor glutamine methyltransferase
MKLFLTNTIRTIIKKWKNKLAILDIEMLIANQIEKNRAFILTHPNHQLTFWQNLKLIQQLKKRENGVPLAYLIGQKEFYGRQFLVDKNTLVPRPETELIIDLMMKKISTQKIFSKKYLILDLGTGSGNIIITLIKEIEKLCQNKKNWKMKIKKYFTFLASDISHKALKMAKKNSKKLNVNQQIIFFNSDLLNDKNLQKKIKQSKKNIIIMANLPYVNQKFKTELLKQKNSQALKFEPPQALWSTQDGLNHYNQLLLQIKKLSLNKINQNLTAYFEINPEQEKLLTQKIKKIFPTAQITFHQDLAGLTRICYWKV